MANPTSDPRGIQPPSPLPTTGSEPFIGLDATVLDFWRFAVGDLRTNNVRGHLAEFLVAQAMGVTHQRVEWDSWDVTSPEGIRIEVKASGFLQAWTQKALSIPTFTVRPTLGWDPNTGQYRTERELHAHVYVFCLQTATDHTLYDPLDISQWAFWVASRSQMSQRVGRSMRLSTLESLCGPAHNYGHLAAAVRHSAAAETPHHQ